MPGQVRPTEARRIRRRLKAVYAGRRFIVVGAALAALANLADELLTLGADRCLLLGSSLGDVDPPGDLPWLHLGISAGSQAEITWRYEAALADPPPWVRRAVDRFDPDGRALVIGTGLLGEPGPVLGRRRFAPRPPAWLRFEDKTAVGALWDAAGVARAPSAVVAVEPPALDRAATALDRGRGTIWAGDAAPGLQGGGDGLRWVHDPVTHRLACAHFSRGHRTVRIMPFLDGLPCSIHGIVSDTGIAVFRPVEACTLCRPALGRIVPAGVASFWDPSPQDREAIRGMARRVGQALDAAAGYRGAFNIDGVLTSDGFLPTELNVRPSWGLRVLTAAAPDLPLGLIALAVQEGAWADLDVGEIEALVLAVADRRRTAAGAMAVAQPVVERSDCPVTLDAGGVRCIAAGQVPDATISLGPSAVGGFLSVLPARTAPFAGRRFAPVMVMAAAFADRTLGTAIGSLEVAGAVQ